MKNQTKHKVKMVSTARRAGTSLQGCMPAGTIYRQLVAVFGNPDTSGSVDSKVSVEWVGTINNQIFTIYDYKTGRNYLGDAGKDVEDLTGDDWHIGGLVEITAQYIVQYFNDQITKIQIPSDEEIEEALIDQGDI